ncbi:MAG TPA: 30S ribosomal protein S6 [Solirubrobacteraceae bacterium]|nr:30S ribosomal protein S6 [Solirubrobacteraceae bacterium]
MTEPIYDLVLLLDSSLDDDRRTKLRADLEQQITRGSGTIVSQHEWGIRKLAFQIDDREEAEYHLLQFSGPRELPGTLRRSLTITDGVVRARIIRVEPGTPPPPQMRPSDAPRAEAPPAEAPAAEPPPAAEAAPADPPPAETPPAETPPAETPATA